MNGHRTVPVRVASSEASFCQFGWRGVVLASCLAVWVQLNVGSDGHR